METVIESNEDKIDDGNLVTSGGATCPEPQQAPSKHRDLEQPKVTSSCIEEPPCPIKNSLIVCGAGITIRWTDNDSTSDQSKAITLGPLACLSDQNENRFAALATSIQNPSDAKQSKWVVPPKTEKQL